MDEILTKPCGCSVELTDHKTICRFLPGCSERVQHLKEIQQIDSLMVLLFPWWEKEVVLAPEWMN